MEFVNLFVLMMFAHFVADFPLQTDVMTCQKSRHSPPPKTYNPKLHGKLQSTWFYYLTSHASVHGFMIWVVTQNVYAGMLETLLHWSIDFGKCEKWYGIHHDQLLHVLSKIIIIVIIF